MTWLSDSGYQVFNPRRFQFPSSRIPILPTRFSLAASSGQSNEYRSLTEGNSYRFFNWGRYALLEAFRLSGVGPAGNVLIPAYHCRTMLDPALSLGSKIGLYAVDAALKPDMESIEKLIAESSVPVRALVATHYFGFPQSFEPLRGLCDRNGITLIEDCSHAFIRSLQDYRTGTQGHFVVGSPYKFCPTMDGGVLLANGHALPRTLRGRGLLDELSSAVHCLQRAKAVPQKITLTAQEHSTVAEQEGDHSWEEGGRISSAFDSASALQQGFRLSHWIVRHSNTDHIAHRRRANYLAWLDGVANMSHCKALYPVLPDDAIPYMFPLYLENPFPDFYALKQAGFPIWRWDSMGISDCAIAMDYRLRLIHMPCHQDIGKPEMAWMLKTLKQAVNGKRGAK